MLYFIKAVKNSCSLQIVNITHNNVIRSGFINIKQCLENLQHTIQIITSYNEINSKGELTTRIYKTFSTGTTEEDVWSFQKHDPDHLATCLSECLKEDNVLQKLNLCYERITSNGAKKIGEAIQVNCTLKKLDINSNRISDDGAATISDGLKSNKSLQELYMSSNQISNEGAKKIGEAIQMNTTLQKMDIHDNAISDDGIAFISDGLKSNNSLQELNISSNQITNEGARNLAEAIKVNTTLHTLHMSQRNINDALSFNMKILTAVYHNNTLMKLWLPYVSGDDKRLVNSEVEKINKERTRQGISTLTCSY